MAPTPNNAGVRFNWDSDPKAVSKLLQFISKKEEYKHAFFPSGHTQIAKKYLIAQKACIEFLSQDPWIIDAKRRGLVRWDEREKKWAATKAWGSSVSNPLSTKCAALARSMKTGMFKRENKIKSKWTKFEDIPKKKDRDRFRAQYPYYFLLRELCPPPRSKDADSDTEIEIETDTNLNSQSRSKSASRGTTHTPQSAPSMALALPFEHLVAADPSSQRLSQPVNRKRRRIISSVVSGSESDISSSDSDADSDRATGSKNRRDRSPSDHAEFWASLGTEKEPDLVSSPVTGLGRRQKRIRYYVSVSPSQSSASASDSDETAMEPGPTGPPSIATTQTRHALKKLSVEPHVVHDTSDVEIEEVQDGGDDDDSESGAESDAESASSSASLSSAWDPSKERDSPVSLPFPHIPPIPPIKPRRQQDLKTPSSHPARASQAAEDVEMQSEEDDELEDAKSVDASSVVCLSPTAFDSAARPSKPRSSVIKNTIARADTKPTLREMARLHGSTDRAIQLQDERCDMKRTHVTSGAREDEGDNARSANNDDVAGVEDIVPGAPRDDSLKTFLEVMEGRSICDPDHVRHLGIPELNDIGNSIVTKQVCKDVMRHGLAKHYDAVATECQHIIHSWIRSEIVLANAQRHIDRIAPDYATDRLLKGYTYYVDPILRAKYLGKELERLLTALGGQCYSDLDSLLVLHLEQHWVITYTSASALLGPVLLSIPPIQSLPETVRLVRVGQAGKMILSKVRTLIEKGDKLSRAMLAMENHSSWRRLINTGLYIGSCVRPRLAKQIEDYASQANITTFPSKKEYRKALGSQQCESHVRVPKSKRWTGIRLECSTAERNRLIAKRASNERIMSPHEFLNYLKAPS
ncbi:hypothetical protein IAU59_000290 [Kwoniella sp. CBS 9459]